MIIWFICFKQQDTLGLMRIVVRQNIVIPNNSLKRFNIHKVCLTLIYGLMGFRWISTDILNFQTLLFIVSLMNNRHISTHSWNRFSFYPDLGEWQCHRHYLYLRGQFQPWWLYWQKNSHDTVIPCRGLFRVRSGDWQYSDVPHLNFWFVLQNWGLPLTATWSSSVQTVLVPPSDAEQTLPEESLQTKTSL